MMENSDWQDSQLRQQQQQQQQHQHQHQQRIDPQLQPPAVEPAGDGIPQSRKSRSRASIACTVCREKRIRCAVAPHESICAHCKRAGTECVFANDDERRRPLSRAYVTSLTSRVALLESMLAEQGVQPPAVVYPAKTSAGSNAANGLVGQQRQTEQAQSLATAPPGSLQRDPDSPGSLMEVTGEDTNSLSADGGNGSSDTDVSQGTPLDDRTDSLVNRLLSTRGRLSLDQLTGQLRYYGPTTNPHIYSDMDARQANAVRAGLEQDRRAGRVIRTLPVETHDYLLALFWEHYNSVLHVVHESAFNTDREHSNPRFYSGFLHMCILAMGYRFADKSRRDIHQLTLPDRESTIHREAKYMLDLELEHPNGVTSIAALLILGDAEVGVGRDNIGWMYAGMAMRLAYDIGINMDGPDTGMSKLENEVRNMTLWACVIYDRYWSLFLGRPTTMKTEDLGVSVLTADFGRLGTCMPAGPAKARNTRIYEALIDLMEIACKIVQYPSIRPESTNHTLDQSSYTRVATIDRELHRWHSKLPHDLRYTEENQQSAPFSYYLLHQQYYAALILLHRPFARHGDSEAGEGDEISALDSHFSKASTSICNRSAVAIARIFWRHRQTFDSKKIFCIAMQHAGAAATALIAVLARTSSSAGRAKDMEYLETLTAALEDMSHAYQPAKRMAEVLKAVLVELGGEQPHRARHTKTRRSSGAARPDGMTSETLDGTPSFKRRNTNQTDPVQLPLVPMQAPEFCDGDVLSNTGHDAQENQPSEAHFVTPQTNSSHRNDGDSDIFGTALLPTISNYSNDLLWTDAHGLGGEMFPPMPSATDLTGLSLDSLRRLGFGGLGTD